MRIATVGDAAERAAHVDLVKRSLQGVRAHSIDVVVSKLVVGANGQVSAKIDVVLSSAAGIRSIASGTAGFVAPKRQLRDASGLRREALRHALEAVRRQMQSQLRPLS